MFVTGLYFLLKKRKKKEKEKNCIIFGELIEKAYKELGPTVFHTDFTCVITLLWLKFWTWVTLCYHPIAIYLNMGDTLFSSYDNTPEQAYKELGPTVFHIDFTCVITLLWLKFWTWVTLCYHPMAIYLNMGDTLFSSYDNTPEHRWHFVIILWQYAWTSKSLFALLISNI